jgi:hypothetical protein
VGLLGDRPDAGLLETGLEQSQGSDGGWRTIVILLRGPVACHQSSVKCPRWMCQKR